MTNSLKRVPPCLRRLAAIIATAFVLFLSPMSQAQNISEVAIDGMIQDLKNPDPVRRRSSAKALGDSKVKRATPALVAAAGDSNAGVRREVVIALDKMLDIRALPAFVKLAGDPEKDIRDRCIVGIIDLYLPQEGGLSVSLNKVANFLNPWSDEWADIEVEPGLRVDPDAVTALSERLQDPDAGIRVKAARALGILKGNAAVPALLQALRQQNTNELRFEVVRALRKIGDTSAAKDLMNYLGYNDAKVRNEAIFTIGRLRYHEAVPELVRLFDMASALPAKMIDKSYREALLEALAFIADPAAKDLFLKETKDPEDGLRLHAYEGLARLGDPAMVTDISRDWLREKEPRIKTAQTYALFHMGRREFLYELVNCLGNGKTNVEARMFLLELKPADLRDLYAEAGNNDVNVREGLAEVMGLIGDENAVPVLQTLAKDRRGQIAALATQALRRVNARTAPR